MSYYDAEIEHDDNKIPDETDKLFERDELDDLSAKTKPVKGFKSFRIPKRWTGDEYGENLRKCTRSLCSLLFRVMRCFHRESEKLLLITHCPFGTDKKLCINIMTQMAMQFFEKSHADPSLPTVLLTAPTGMAAWAIKGITLYSAFGIPSNVENYQSLSLDRLKEYEHWYLNARVLIIDEIYAVSYNLFNFVDLRLREIKNCNEPFGGMHVLVFGDLLFPPPPEIGEIFKLSRGVEKDLLWRKFKYFKLKL